MLISWHLHILGNDHHSRSSNHLFTYKLCSFAQACPALCDPMDWNMPGFPVLHYLLKFAQTHVHWVNDAIQPSHPLLPPSLAALNHSQHQGLFQWNSSSHQVDKILEVQLQHQSFQWMFRVDWFDLLAVQGTLKSLLQHLGSVQKHQFFSALLL